MPTRRTSPSREGGPTNPPPNKPPSRTQSTDRGGPSHPAGGSANPPTDNTAPRSTSTERKLVLRPAGGPANPPPNKPPSRPQSRGRENPSHPTSAVKGVSMDTQTDIPWENICLDESFFQPLPQLHTAAEWVKKSDLSYSSPAVSATVPPAYWLEVDATHYLLKADKALEKPKVKRYLQVRANPSTDPLFRMRVEADVVRFGNEQLVFHVNHALFANFGATIESFSEYHTDGCRPDKVWRQYDPKGNAHEAVALLESKIKCGIEENEFLAAKLYPGEDPKKKLAAVVRKTKKTHFMKKSLKIMSQVSKYARSQVFNTNYVALFDSNYLFLCVFDQQNPVALKGTLIPCQGPKSNIARRAFLGWLIEAWEKKCEGENFRAPPHPDDGKTKKKDKKDNADEAP